MYVYKFDVVQSAKYRNDYASKLNESLNHSVCMLIWVEIL